MLENEKNQFGRDTPRHRGSGQKSSSANHQISILARAGSAALLSASLFTSTALERSPLSSSGRCGRKSLPQLICADYILHTFVTYNPLTGDCSSRTDAGPGSQLVLPHPMCVMVYTVLPPRPSVQRRQCPYLDATFELYFTD